MQLGLAPLFEQLDRAPNARYVLATVVGTSGSSYRKSGAMMLLTPGVEPVGLVSGGCLEGDLMAHARAVFDDGRKRFVRYDLSEDAADLWGLGLGCGGAIEVMLENASREVEYAGLAAVRRHWLADRFCWLLKSLNAADQHLARVVTRDRQLPAAARPLVAATMGRTRAARQGGALLRGPVLAPPRMTICGAGPDAVPVAAIAAHSGWRVTVIDHRPALACAERFADRVEVVCTPMQNIPSLSVIGDAHAIVIMAHHLENDARYLACAVAGDARYIGLLGPAARRDDVIARAAVPADPRVFGPAGLAIGADLPETIALSIVAQAHAVVHGASGGNLA